MPEISAKVVSTSAPNSGLGSSLSKINNVDWNFSTADYMLSRPADFFVYLFNIAKQEYKISRLPVIKEMVIPARKEGEKYARVTKLPSPMKMPKGNIDSNEIDIVIMDGRRMAMDIINPDNWTLDQDAVLTHSDSVGQNIGRLGVFWSLNEVPTEAELAAATRRLETHYRNLLTEARTTETSNAAALPAVLQWQIHCRNRFGILVHRAGRGLRSPVYYSAAINVANWISYGQARSTGSLGACH